DSDSLHLERLIRGFQVSQLIWMAAELDIANRIAPGEKVPVSRLAEACGVNPQRLLRLGGALAALGIFDVTEGELLGHTRLSLLLRTGSERNLLLQARFWAGPGNWNAWGQLRVALSSGRSPHDAA